MTFATLLARCGVVGLLVPLFACTTSGTGDIASKGNSVCVGAPVDMSYDTRIVNMLRIYTGSDGVSHAQMDPQLPQESTYLGALLRQYPLGDPSNVVIVSGPPDFRISKHPAPYREIFVLLSGASTIELSDGTERSLRAGSVVLFEDTTGPGHGGHFGPCGYVALDIQFKPSNTVAR